MTAARCIIAGCLCLMLGACAAQPGQEAASARFIAAQKQEARRLEDEGELARALAVWRTLLPLRKDDSEIGRSIDALQLEIAERTDASLHSARTAYGTGNIQRGDRLMLSVLALQPGNEEALKALGDSASARASAQQQSKSEEENRVAMRATAKPPDPMVRDLQALYLRQDYSGMIELAGDAQPAGDPEVAAMLRSAHIGLAEKAERGGDYGGALEHLQAAMVMQPRQDDPLMARSLEIRGQLSGHWYREGSRLINSDLNGAIAALENSLKYNPYNSNAKRKLAQARTLQSNLEKIEGR